MKGYDEAIEKLEIYDQKHIIKFLEDLDGIEKEELVEQINNIDFQQISELYANTKKEIEIEESNIESIKYSDRSRISKDHINDLEEKGSAIISSGQYAVVTMAGGQGTRLGHKGPKGTFKLDVYGKGKYLFEILIEDLKRANEKYGVTIPWYIMTSKENNEETKEFLEKNNFFGYDKDSIIFFQQGELPLIDTEGKLLMGKDMKIKEASNGNGGVYTSLRSSGALSDMKERGIKWVFIGGVDNALIKMADPILIGLTIENDFEIGSKSVVKTNPQEKVGVFCKMNGHPKIIEYIELPEELSEEVDENGELKYGESNILCHLFTVDALEKASKEDLIFHSAFKKNSYMNENGIEVVPEKENSYKFEAFIFDVFRLFDNMALLRVKREEEFAPIKNKEGSSSPKTAKELYETYWKNEK